MGRLSIDNGIHYIDCDNAKGIADAVYAIGTDTIVNYMDNDTREAVHNGGNYYNDSSFVSEYLRQSKHDLIIG